MNKLNLMLLLVVMLSGLSVITIRHQTRLYYADLNKAQKMQIKLNDDFSRLRVDQAQWSNNHLIKKAANTLQLRPPGVMETVIVHR